MSMRPSKSAGTKGLQYQKLDNDEALEIDGDDSKKGLSKNERRRRRAEKAEYYSTKLHALLWIVIAILVAYYTNFFQVCRNSQKVRRHWFNLGIILFVTSAVFVLYMAIYVPYVLKIDYEPQVYAPRMLPITGVAMLLCGISFIFALWPVYGLFTPGLLFLLWIAMLMTAHFLPAI